MTKLPLLPALALILTACQPALLWSDEVTLRATLQVEAPRYGVQAVIQPLAAADIASVSLRVSEGGTPVASMAIARADLSRTLVFTHLRRSKTYLVSAQAFDAGNQLISLDAGSAATIVTGEASYPDSVTVPIQLKDRPFDGTATAPGGITIRSGGYSNPSGGITATVITADPTPYTVEAPEATDFDFTISDAGRLPLYTGIGNHRYATIALPCAFEFLGQTYPAGSLVTVSNKGTLHFSNPDTTILVLRHPTDYWDPTGTGFGIAYATFANGLSVKWRVKDAGNEASFGVSLYAPTNASHSFDLFYGKVPAPLAGTAQIGVNFLTADTLFAPALGTGEVRKRVRVHH